MNLGSTSIRAAPEAISVARVLPYASTPASGLLHELASTNGRVLSWFSHVAPDGIMNRCPARKDESFGREP